MSITPSIRIPNGTADYAQSLLNATIGVPDEMGQPPLVIDGWSELSRLPPPEWIWDQVFQSDSVVLMVGAPASFKTFFALHLKTCITMGKNFGGRQVRKGNVLYLAAEGRRNLFERFMAIAKHHVMAQIDGLNVISSSPQIADESAMDALREAIQKVKPDVIFIDTAFKHFAEYDPGQTAGAQAIVRTCEKLRIAYGCAVVLIHHPPKGSKKQIEHGAAPLMAGVDTAIYLAKDKGGKSVTLSCMKQKSAKEFKPFVLRVNYVPIFRDEQSLEIPVVTGDLCSDSAEAPPSGESEEGLLRVLEVIASLGESATPKNIHPKADISESHFHRIKAILMERDLIAQSGERRPYEVTEKGYEALKGLSSKSQGS